MVSAHHNHTQTAIAHSVQSKKCRGTWLNKGCRPCGLVRGNYFVLQTNNDDVPGSDPREDADADE